MLITQCYAYVASLLLEHCVLLYTEHVTVSQSARNRLWVVARSGYCQLRMQEAVGVHLIWYHFGRTLGQ